MTKSYCDFCGDKVEHHDGFSWKIRVKVGKRFKIIEFCSDKCVSNYISKTMQLYFETLNIQEKRIARLEKKK